jgi:spore coat protein U-like protein
MHSWPIRIFAALVFCCCSSMAAAQGCTVTANDLASANLYDPFSASFNDSAGAFTINCTRARGGGNRFDNTYYAGADNGLNYTTSRRLRNGTNFLNYALYQNYPGCSTAWGSVQANVVTLANSATGPNDTTTAPNPLANRSYCFRITGGMNTAPPGTYTDMVTIGVADSNGVVRGSDVVTLSTTIQASCAVTWTLALPLTISYTSFSPTAPSGTKGYQLRCTNTTTYTLGFDAPVVGVNDKVLGLNYTLGNSSASGVGSGIAQPYTVTATIPANQAGTCNAANGAACTGTVTRAVMITY